MKKISVAKNLKGISIIDWVKTAILVVLFILLVVWIGNFWLLLLLPLVADIYSTRIIPWNFWRKPNDKGEVSKLAEWIDAIVFAVIAVYFINIFLFQNYKIPSSSLEKSMLVGDHLFVSKVSYGPRMPNAPLFIPMVQNEIFGVKSYLDWPMWDYKRLAGLGQVQRGDIVVFNFPAGDTVCRAMPNPDYYTIIWETGLGALRNVGTEKVASMKTTWERNHYICSLGRQSIRKESSPLNDIVSRPVDKRDCYVKRCIGLPGDSLAIRHNEVFINGTLYPDAPEAQHNYYITTNNVSLNDRFFDSMGISNEDRRQGGSGTNYYLPLTKDKAQKVSQMDVIKSIKIDDDPADSLGGKVYPYAPECPWSRDNYGPIWIPKKGATIDLDEKNVVLYERAITAYEGHSLDFRNGKAYVDGVESNTFTFTMDYYFMLGDNRHKSADSRYWGFVPEDHVIGKPVFIWLSLDPDKSGLSAIRTERFLKTDF